MGGLEDLEIGVGLGGIDFLCWVFMKDMKIDIALKSWVTEL